MTEAAMRHEQEQPDQSQVRAGDGLGATAVENGGVRVESVSKSLGIGAQRRLILDDVSLSIGRGEFVSVIGPSGCGKSTLLKIVAGLRHPDRGRVLIDGEDPDEATRNKAIGLVPQDPALLPWRNVLSNVELPMKLNRKANAQRAMRDPTEVLTAMGLGDALKRYPAELSGGMQQRVAIARAYVFDPDVLLMDEPFSALDEINRDQQRMDLLDFWQSNRKSVLFVTHSVPEAVILSDRILVMSSHPGRISHVVEVDLPRPRTQEMFEDPRFHELQHHVQVLLHATLKGAVHA